MADPQTLIPQIAEEDVEWISGVMGLREFDQPRQDFLRANTTLDVSACPGSGKTTLIVAKLAIMARKWPHRTKGICVLSHTNAAREEIQRRLRGTGIGQQLLSYPHFVDTIHGFVNQFLALPWLNSNGFPSATVNDDITSGFRRRFLSAECRKVDYYLKKQYSAFDNIRLADRCFQIKLSDNGRDRAFPAGPESETYRLARSAVEQSSRAGFFCYDEMFIWARALLEDFPSVAALLQHRFPLVIVDEMQDTSDLQVGILDDVFPRSTSDVVLQRVGDPNQAVFQRPQHRSAMPGQFPDPASCMTIPNSFRFGQAIATLASPFAVHAVGPNGLQGVGPPTVEDAPKPCQNAIFIFPDAEPHVVLDAYGQHVLTSFGDETLSIGDVTAVGAIHQDANDVTAGDPHFPKTVPHYWSRYTKEVGRNEPHPRTLIQYVRVAQALARDGHDHAPGVEMIASGIVRLARRSGTAERIGRRAPRHRTLVEAISPNVEATSAYRRLLKAFLVDSEALTVASWAQRQADLLLVAAALGAPGAVPNSDDSFLGWDQLEPSAGGPSSNPPQDAGPNVYRFDDGDGRSVDIRLGSVHSVKGQTHLATMLLSTYWYDHSAKRLLPWLMGEKMNLNGAGDQDRARLHQTYVAMTRPSYLICLAVPRSALGEEAVLSARVARMIGRGWHVAHVVDGAPSWHS
jgi:DNA helicase-2/ATP-dependent DNA helicase PcrA